MYDNSIKKKNRPPDQITHIIGLIYKRGMTTTSGGNISVIDDKGNIWITPSGIDKGNLKSPDIICIHCDGTFSGKHKPSSEYPFHKALYKARPDIRAIIHAHPPALVSFSIVHQIPDTSIDPITKGICGPVGYAAYQTPGSEALGIQIAEQFKKGFNALIMENHGTVVGGKDLEDAYCRFETLEYCARTTLYSRIIGLPLRLENSQIEQFQATCSASLPERSGLDNNTDEIEKRNAICAIIKRACEHELMISTFGTVSLRIQKNDFLITPEYFSRWDVLPEDIVAIKDMHREPAKIPSRFTQWHYEIYNRYPEIHSIICTQSPYLMSFAVTGEKFDVRTIPESWIFLQDIPLIPFSESMHRYKDISDLVSPGRPGVILQNYSFLITGTSLLQAFDRLEVAEFSAKSLIMAKSIGDLKPINDSQIEELRRVFLI